MTSGTIRPSVTAARYRWGMRDQGVFGPQFRGDSAFTARMRLHQSWYRAAVLGVPWARYGNMLDEAAGMVGLNFLTLPPAAREASVRQR